MLTCHVLKIDKPSGSIWSYFFAITIPFHFLEAFPKYFTTSVEPLLSMMSTLTDFRQALDTFYYLVHPAVKIPCIRFTGLLWQLKCPFDFLCPSHGSNNTIIWTSGWSCVATTDLFHHDFTMAVIGLPDSPVI